LNFEGDRKRKLGVDRRHGDFFFLGGLRRRMRNDAQLSPKATADIALLAV
jgi:hypothetical protein